LSLTIGIKHLGKNSLRSTSHKKQCAVCGVVQLRCAFPLSPNRSGHPRRSRLCASCLDAKRKSDPEYRARQRDKQKVWRDKGRAKVLGIPEPTRPAPAGCELCGRAAALHRDHCHETGAFRGWLCCTCNTAIGKLGDNAQGLERALDYLRGCLKRDEVYGWSCRAIPGRLAERGEAVQVQP
jgi:hypothetical protein